MQDASTPRKESGLLWLNIASVALVALCMFGLSWQQWPDVIIDFGRQCYLAWRITEGEVLVRDLSHFFGPLSPYINALWFKLFGISILTLAWSNLIIFIAFMGITLALLATISTLSAATLAAYVGVLVFGFSQLLTSGSQNFICPYSHEITHALLFSMCALACLFRYQFSSRTRWWLLTGFFTGLVFLTKPEVLVALLAAIACWVLLDALDHPGQWRATLRQMLLFIVSAAAAPLITSILFSTAMPPAEALRATLGSWPSILFTHVTDQPFYAKIRGTADLNSSLLDLCLSLSGYIGYAGVVALLAAKARGRLENFLSLTLIGFLLSVAAIENLWKLWLRPLPLFLLLLLFLTFRQWRKHSRAEENTDRKVLALRFTLMVFALALMLKVILRVQIAHYGFALAILGTLFLVISVVEWFPNFLGSRGYNRTLARRCGYLVILALCIPPNWTTLIGYQRKSYTVGSAGDAIKASHFQYALYKTSIELLRDVDPSATVALLPEGAMMNYQLRRINPTGHLNFFPIEMEAYGENNFLAAFEKHPPDYILIWPRDLKEFGHGALGVGFGQNLMAWIKTHYSVERTTRESYEDCFLAATLLRYDPEEP